MLRTTRNGKGLHGLGQWRVDIHHIGARCLGQRVRAVSQHNIGRPGGDGRHEHGGCGGLGHDIALEYSLIQVGVLEQSPAEHADRALLRLPDRHAHAIAHEVVESPNQFRVPLGNDQHDIGLRHACARPEQLGHGVEVVNVARDVGIREPGVIAFPDDPHLGGQDAAAVVDGIDSDSLARLKTLDHRLQCATVHGAGKQSQFGMPPPGISRYRGVAHLLKYRKAMLATRNIARKIQRGGGRLTPGGDPNRDLAAHGVQLRGRDDIQAGILRGGRRPDDAGIDAADLNRVGDIGYGRLKNARAGHVLLQRIPLPGGLQGITRAFADGGLVRVSQRHANARFQKVRNAADRLRVSVLHHDHGHHVGNRKGLQNKPFFACKR